MGASKADFGAIYAGFRMTISLLVFSLPFDVDEGDVYEFTIFASTT